MILGRLARLLVTLAAASIGLAPIATCMSTPVKSDADMPCCAKASHDCMPSAGNVQSCCKTHGQDHQTAVAKQESAGRAPVAVVVSRGPVVAETLERVRTHTRRNIDLRVRSAPLYVLDSALLI